jgi:soluble lytic murein transglycosylase-like protein
MNLHRTLLASLLLISGAALAQQSPSPGVAEKMKAFIARQQNAIVRMAPSIDRQKDAVRRHAHQEADASGDGFFTLPPPPRSLALLDPPACDALPPAEVEQLVDSAAHREDVDPGLIRSVMRTESAYRPCALSAKGAMGLMQLMPETAGDLVVNDPFDPQQNVEAGAKLLKELLHRYDGDLTLALSAYNAGPAKVDRNMSVPAIPETINYVEKILSAYPVQSIQTLSPPQTVVPSGDAVKWEIGNW